VVVLFSEVQSVLRLYCNNVPNAELQHSKRSSDWQQFWAHDSISLICIQLAGEYRERLWQSTSQTGYKTCI